MRFLIALFCIPLWATSYNLSISGTLWGVSGAWSPNGIPGNGDTVNIPDGMTVTVNDNEVVGTSTGTGSVAVQLNNSGTLIISSGGVLAVRGDIVYTANNCANTSTAVIMQAGSTLEFDSSSSYSASTVHYQFGPSGGSGCRPFVSSGSAASRNVIRSNAGGGAGRFSLRGNNGSGGSFMATYTDFLRIGDAASPGWQVAYEYSGNHSITWDVTNGTFSNCGAITSGNLVGIDGSGTFRHSHNFHSQSAGSEIFSQWYNINPPGSGVREIRNNVFDIPMSSSFFYLVGFTVWSNYFARATLTGAGIWNSFQGNLIRFDDTAVGFGPMAVTADMLDSYVFVDSDWGNPKPLTEGSSSPANLRGIIYGQAGTALGPPGVVDSGELWFNFPQQTPTTIGIYNSIILPNMAGHSSLELGSVTGGITNMTTVAEHVTWFGGYTGTTAQGTWGFPAMQLGEGGNGWPGMVGSFRSNILWNPQLQTDSTGTAHDYRSSFFKLADLSNSPAPVIDYCAPANCDFNAGYGHTVTDASKPQYVNQQKGYAAAFSSAPGVHDVDVNPGFVDPYRTLELFDSKYLGNNPLSWSAGAHYQVGDFVSWGRQDIYWKLPVNYRYVNGGACGGTNPEPGGGPHWRDCWEWASLYRIRQAISNGTTYDDQTIGAHGYDAIMTLMQWIRAGYAPTNLSLLGTAHDGTDIGAVPVAVSVSYPTSTGNTVRGVIVK